MGWLKTLKKILRPSNRGLILMYHRVIDLSIDPWQLAVSPKNFENHLQLLKASGLVVSLSVLLETLSSKKKLESPIAITFDDGYADNFINAKPLLEKYEIPATFFISTKHIGSPKSFWWDQLADLVLMADNLPEHINLEINGEQFFFELIGEKALTEKMTSLHRKWNANQPPPTKRSKLYMKLWEKLRTQDYEKQIVILDELKRVLNITQIPDVKNVSMTEEQLNSLVKNRLFHLGGHTVTHPLMSGLTKKAQEEEVLKNKQYLESLTGQELRFFAYPYGNFNQESIDVIRKQGFKAALTTDEKPVQANQDPYQLGRFQMMNWNKQDFQEVLKNWL